MFTRIFAKTHFGVILSLFIHPCTKKRKRAQFKLQMCAQKTSHTALDCSPNYPERLLCSPCPFGQSLYRVLIREFEQECMHWAVMHRRTLCENVDSAKIKVPIYTTEIDILHVASMHRIVRHRIDVAIHIDESLHPQVLSHFIILFTILFKKKIWLKLNAHKIYYIYSINTILRAARLWQKS